MFFAKIPRHTRQNAITEGDSECILTRNCEGTEQLRNTVIIHRYNMDPGLIRPGLFHLKSVMKRAVTGAEKPYVKITLFK